MEVMPAAAEAKPDMASLVASRICHDLVSPLGAIANGLELLAMSGMTASPEFALISESVAAANDRIRFFRIAFGQAAVGQRIARSDLLAAIDAQRRLSRLAIDWTVAPDGCDRGFAKLALLSILCLESAMPRGGTVVVGTGESWQVTGRSDIIRNDNPLWAHLDAPSEIGAPSPAHVQFALLASEARQLQRRIGVQTRTGQIAINF